MVCYRVLLAVLVTRELSLLLCPKLNKASEKFWGVERQTDVNFDHLLYSCSLTVLEKTGQKERRKKEYKPVYLALIERVVNEVTYFWMLFRNEVSKKLLG